MAATNVIGSGSRCHVECDRNLSSSWYRAGGTVNSGIILPPNIGVVGIPLTIAGTNVGVGVGCGANGRA